MEQKTSHSDSRLMFVKFMRVLTYCVYAYAVIAAGFLIIGFVLLLFGANPATPFVAWVYKVAQDFLEPFRGIFPLHKISETAYFSPSALFAALMYMLIAAGLHTFITYLAAKMYKFQRELASQKTAAGGSPAETPPKDVASNRL